MKIVFNGLLEKKSGGCNCRKASNGYSFVNAKMYILPSGQRKTFYVGKVEEVSDKDGQFLLSYKTTDANGVRQIFSRVEG